MTFSDNTVQTEGLGNFFKNLGRKALTISKKMAKNVLKNLGRPVENGANLGSAFASRSLNQFSQHAKNDQFLSLRKKVVPWEISLVLCHLN